MDEKELEELKSKVVALEKLKEDLTKQYEEQKAITSELQGKCAEYENKLAQQLNTPAPLPEGETGAEMFAKLFK